MSNFDSLVKLAETLDEARKQANAIEKTAPQGGVYGAISNAEIQVLQYALGETTGLDVYDNIVQDGNSVRRAIRMVTERNTGKAGWVKVTTTEGVKDADGEQVELWGRGDLIRLSGADRRSFGFPVVMPKVEFIEYDIEDPNNMILWVMRGEELIYIHRIDAEHPNG